MLAGREGRPATGNGGKEAHTRDLRRLLLPAGGSLRAVRQRALSDLSRGDARHPRATPAAPPRATGAAAGSGRSGRLDCGREPAGQRAPQVRERIPWKLIVFAVLAVYALLIIFLNREQVEVSFVFFSAKISKLVLILLCVGIGFAGGYLFEQLRERRKQRSSSAE